MTINDQNLQEGIDRTRSEKDPNTELNMPIFVDLDNYGVELTGWENNHAFYDLNNDGFRENVGWVAPDDGILVIDLDRNGVIDKANEVNFTLNAPDAATDLDGLRKAFDSNGDNLLNAYDIRFSDFRVWQDRDGDGVSDLSELHTMTEIGIASVGLVSSRVNEVHNGNTIVGYANYTRFDGSTGLVADAGVSHSAFSYRITKSGIDILADLPGSVVNVFNGATFTDYNVQNRLLIGHSGNETLEGRVGQRLAGRWSWSRHTFRWRW